MNWYGINRGGSASLNNLEHAVNGDTRAVCDCFGCANLRREVLERVQDAVQCDGLHEFAYRRRIHGAKSFLRRGFAQAMKHADLGADGEFLRRGLSDVAH